MKLSLLQIGPITHVGGVSVHIKRLAKLVSDEYDTFYIDECSQSIKVDNIPSLKRVVDYRNIFERIIKSNIIHIHLGNWILRLFILIVGRVLGKNMVVTIHGQNTIEDLSGFQKFLTMMALNWSDSLICVNSKIVGYLSPRLIEKSLVLEAFIPPDLRDENNLPGDLYDRIQHYKRTSFLLCANAYRLIQYENSQLYGLDQCLGMLKIAKAKKVNIHLFYVISQISKEDVKLYKYFQSEIVKNGLAELITLTPKPISFISLIQECDVVLRPTLTDGDALTVREALWCLKPVIASNIVDRPLGTITYEVGSPRNLFSVLENLLNNFGEFKHQGEVVDYRKIYKKVYNTCVE